MTTPPLSATVATDSTIATRILEGMKDAGLSLLGLSEKTDIPYKTLQRSIKGGVMGHRSLTIGQFRAIVHVLNLRPSEVLEDDASVKSPDAA
ncbi:MULTISPECIES: hypothetical protein [Arthrobacter]|uniref:HTH cro/C1-type domain-containing protein n=1 Tax=Arthrobacter terricola TaxID=2547396 RepID=A0A4V2ZRQ0_9MICC|nr:MULTISPECIES: hypothetical protein [Arthrobacter]MBT8163086.1 hypothetical protein [Arthrobacter sp. GN70]TDF88126.1 hypothetical protein E1809_24205 [Arthrobacter terricola]